MLRSCYTAPARFYRGGPVGQIEWYFADDDAQIYMGPNRFFPRSQELQYTEENLGELTTARPNTYSKGTRPPQMLGQEFHGSEDDFMLNTVWPGPHAIEVPTCVLDSIFSPGFAIAGLDDVAAIDTGFALAAMPQYDKEPTGGIAFGSFINQKTFEVLAGFSFASFARIVGVSDEHTAGMALGSHLDPPKDPIANQLAGLAFGSVITPSGAPVLDQLGGMSFGGVTSPVGAPVLDQDGGLSFASRDHCKCRDDDDGGGGGCGVPTDPGTDPEGDTAGGVAFGGVLDSIVVIVHDQDAGVAIAGVETPIEVTLGNVLGGISLGGVAELVAGVPGFIGGIAFGAVTDPSFLPIEDQVGGMSFAGVTEETTFRYPDQVSGIAFAGVTEETTFRYPDQVSGISLAGVTEDALPPPPTVLLHDTFTDTDGTAITSHTPDVKDAGVSTYSSVWGSMRIEGGGCAANTYASGVVCDTFVTLGQTSWTMTCDISPGGHGNNIHFGFNFRWSDASNRFQAWVEMGASPGTAYYKVAKVAGGAVTSLFDPGLDTGFYSPMTIEIEQTPTGFTVNFGTRASYTSTDTFNGTADGFDMKYVNIAGAVFTDDIFDNLLIVQD